MSIQSNTQAGHPTVQDRQGRHNEILRAGKKIDNPPDRHGEGIKGMPKENAINGKRPKSERDTPQGDKRGHQDKKDYDRMHAREPLPGDSEKAQRPYHAKDAQKGAQDRRSNPDRDRAGLSDE